MFIDLIRQSFPDFEILDCIAIVILGGTLPCYDKGAQRGEAQLVYVWCREDGNDVTDRSVNDRNSARRNEYGLLGGCQESLLLRRGPGEVLAVRRVAAAAEVALGPGSSN